MALLYDPSITYSNAGNVLATTTTLNASANSNGNIVTFGTNTLGGTVCVWCKGGATVNATNGCQVGIFPQSDANSNYDTISWPALTLAAVVNTANRQSIMLPTGNYNIQLTNLDPANAITVGLTSNPIA